MQTTVLNYPSALYDPTVSSTVDQDATLKKRVTVMLDTIKGILAKESSGNITTVEGKLDQGTHRYVVRVVI